MNTTNLATRGVTGRRRAAWLVVLGAFVLGGVVSAAPAFAAGIVEVRVGLHPGFTRVVFETDAPARYRVERTPAGEIRVHLGATTEGLRMKARGPVLDALRIDAVSGGRGALARLRLKADVEVEELVLSKPARIVLDLRPRSAAGETSGSKATASTPKPETAPKTRPTEVARAPEPAPVRQPEPARVEEAAKPTPEPALPTEVEKPGEMAAAGEPEEAPAEEPTAEPEAAAVAETGASGDGAGAAEEPTPAESEPLAETDPILAAADAEPSPIELFGEEAEGVAGLPAPTRPGAMSPPPPARKAPVAPPPRQTAQADEGGLSFLPGALSDPRILAGIGALALVLLVTAVLRSRKSDSEIDSVIPPFEGDEPFSIDEAEAQPATVGFEEEEEPAAVPAAAAPEETGGFEPTANTEDYDVTEGHTEMDQGFDSPIADSSTSPIAAAAGMEADVMEMFQKLSSRVDQLESRLQEVTEAKERLERQVAAQTEELRVQRAAIARTQRVLRTVVRSDEDEATEPAPKE